MFDAHSQMMEGGSLFAQRVVEEIIAWASHLDNPTFLIVTTWNNSVVLSKSKHYSPFLQYTTPTDKGGAKRQKADGQWCVSYIPMRRLPRSLEGVRKYKNVNMDHEQKLSYHYEDDDDVIQLMRNSFEADAWRDGHPTSADLEALPRLYTVDSDGFLQLVPSNMGNSYGALNVDDWEAMVACYLSMIKKLTKGSKKRLTQDE